MRRLAPRWRTILWAAALIAVAFVAFAAWYSVHFSMEVARSFEVNDPGSRPRVLIATQGSEFKDAVVSAVVEHLRTRPAYVKVIDVSALPRNEEAEWDVVVLVHTWEMGKPPGDVVAFLQRAREPGKIVALSTSGAGNFKVEGVDAISSASVVEDAASRAAEITAKVDAILAAGAGSPRTSGQHEGHPQANMPGGHGP